MKNLTQLSFDFTNNVVRPTNDCQRIDWRVGHLAKRHRLPVAMATLYAREMGLPVGETRP